MTVSTSSPGKKADSPMLWNITPSKMMMELKDEQNKKGVVKRVIFNRPDSTWIMLLSYNGRKLASRLHAAHMYKDTINKLEKKLKIRSTTDLRTIENYSCKKFIAESDSFITELWVTDQLQLNVCKVYKLLSHCGLMSDYTMGGDWYFWRNKKGMILELTSTNKSTQESYKMTITNIIPSVVQENLFSLEGFRITDIPPGQNCGTIEK